VLKNVYAADFFKKNHIDASKRQKSHASEISTGKEKLKKRWQRDKRCCRCFKLNWVERDKRRASEN